MNVYLRLCPSFGGIGRRNPICLIYQIPSGKIRQQELGISLETSNPYIIRVRALNYHDNLFRFSLKFVGACAILWNLRFHTNGLDWMSLGKFSFSTAKFSLPLPTLSLGHTVSDRRWRWSSAFR